MQRHCVHSGAPVVAGRPSRAGHLFGGAAQLARAPRAAARRPPPRCRRLPCHAAVGVEAGAAAATVALPQPLRDATAVLESASGSKIYVLGVSHVSKESCRQVEELINLVRPDIVLLELCKERVPLLVNPDDPPPTLWHSSRQRLVGLPAGASWPTAAELLAHMRCRGGAPVTASQIEDDAASLLATGVFGSVSLNVKPSSSAAAPAFVVGSGGALQTVAPMGEIEFTVKERSLPKVTQLEVVLEAGDAAALADAAAQVQAAVLQRASEGLSAVSCYLQARQGLLELFPEEARQDLEVVFSGVESGKAQALVRPVPAGQRRSLTGLEGSAANGQGWGITPLQRRARPQQAQQGVRLGAGLQLDPSALAAVASPGGSGSIAGKSSGSGSGSGLAQEAQTQWRPWSEEELQRGEAEAARAAAQAGAGSGLSGAFATAITQAYATLQAKAGRQVGIPPGAAWRAALRAAAACGAQQVLLGDRPGNTTAQRLADAIWANCSPFILGSIPAAVASAIIVSSSLDAGAATPLAAGAAALLPLAAAAWPVAAPLLEISRFAGMSAAEIEETVRVKEPVQSADPAAPIIKLWGEDALLDWPGALGPIIHERDAYMAKTLAAAANGTAQGLTPAYVRAAGGAASEALLRYAMPKGANPVVCPEGYGEGQYQPLPEGRTVVGVVGTAHMRGIIRAWAEAQRNPDLSPYV